MKQYEHWSRIPCIKVQVTEEEQILEYLQRQDELMVFFTSFYPEPTPAYYDSGCWHLQDFTNIGKPYYITLDDIKPINEKQLKYVEPGSWIHDIRFLCFPAPLFVDYVQTISRSKQRVDLAFRIHTVEDIIPSLYEHFKHSIPKECIINDDY